MISIWELTEALTLEWAKQDLWGLGAESYTANVFPIKSAGNPCVAKCSL